MRPERLSLQDIVEAADNIAFHIGNRSREQFLGDRTVRAAVLHEITVIGEAAARLPGEFRGRHYFGLDWPIVWDTAATLVPALREQVAGVLSAEFPESSGSTCC